MTMNHKRSSIAITHYSESPNKEQDYQSMKLFEHKTKVLSKHGAIVPANIYIYICTLVNLTHKHAIYQIEPITTQSPNEISANTIVQIQRKNKEI